MYRRITQLLVITWLSLSMSTFALGADPQNWKIKIRVDGSNTYGYGVAGVKATATDGHDLAWDVQALLDNLNNDAADPYIYVYFPHTELGVNFSEDIKDTFLPKDWIIEIDSNITGLLTITWPDMAAKLPTDREASLTDLDGPGAPTINMLQTSSYSFQNSAGVLRQFQLTISEPAAGPYFLSAVAKNKVVNLIWEMAQEEDAYEYIILRKINDGTYEEKARQSIAEYRFDDKLEKSIVRAPGQTQLTYQIATVNAAGDVIRSSIEVTVIYTSRY